jgi:hypothetical protein
MLVTLVRCVTYIVKHPVCVYNVNIYYTVTHFVKVKKYLFCFSKCVKCRNVKKKILMYTHNALKFLFFSKCVDLVPNLTHFERFFFQSAHLFLECTATQYSLITRVMAFFPVVSLPLYPS